MIQTKRFIQPIKIVKIIAFNPPSLLVLISCLVFSCTKCDEVCEYDYQLLEEGSCECINDFELMGTNGEKDVLESGADRQGFYYEPCGCANENGSFLLGDKDGFGIGLVDGQIYDGDWFDHREKNDPAFTDKLPPPNFNDFTYCHAFDPCKNINSAELNLLTLGIQDGDKQVYQSDTDIKLFINGIEIPHAFDDVDQFDRVDSKWVSFAGYVTIPIPENLLIELTSGRIDVRIVTLALGEYQGLDVFALDYSELIIR